MPLRVGGIAGAFLPVECLPRGKGYVEGTGGRLRDLGPWSLSGEAV